MDERKHIETATGILEAEVWHVGANMRLYFNDNFYAVINGTQMLENFRRALQDRKRSVILRNQAYNSEVHISVRDLNHDKIILKYLGTERESFGGAVVVMTNAGLDNLIAMIDVAIEQGKEGGA